MPVAMISTDASPCLRPFQVEFDDLERLFGGEPNCGAGFHNDFELLCSARTVDRDRWIRSGRESGGWLLLPHPFALSAAPFVELAPRAHLRLRTML